MAKRTRTKGPPGKAPGKPASAPVAAPPPPKPVAPPPKAKRTAATSPADHWLRFWAYDISWVRWCVFRFAFFGLLSVDAFLQLSHAPRYGAGGFNVQHLPGAPLPEPGRPSITFAHAAMCLLFALVAQGILTRVTLPLAALLYGWAYFSSQLDAYQHHYLVWLLLVILCFVPHAPDPRLPSAAPATPRRMTSWAVRLALVQVGIVYLWAAISKMTPLWLDGTALDLQIAGGTMRGIASSLGFGTVAKLVLAAELVLAVAVWWRPAWPIALAGGIGLHAGVELIGLDIGLFSYLMFAVYLLAIPDRVYLAAARALAPYLRVDDRRLFWIRAGWVAAPLALVALLLLVPLSFGLPVVLAFVLLAAAGIRGVRRAGWAFAVAAAIPIAADAATDTADDYYRYWAGSARRMGNDAEARRAYLGLLEVDADSEYANFHLGNLEAAAGNLERAASHYVRAERKSGVGRTRAFVAEAQIRLRQNDPARARAALERALRIDPADAAARRMLATLDGTLPSAPPTPDAPEED